MSIYCDIQYKPTKDHSDTSGHIDPITETNIATLPNAIISDLDRTLALFGKTDNPYYRDYSKDIVNHSVYTILQRFHQDTTIFIVSGRKEADREATQLWLSTHSVPYNALYLRQNDDNRSDDIVKHEIYDKYIKDRYKIIAVFDDRLRVCRLWYSLNLPLFRVGDPDADF